MASVEASTKHFAKELERVTTQLQKHEAQAGHLRNERDQLFVAAYDARSISVTEMARISGMRRESVHDAINRTKGAVTA